MVGCIIDRLLHWRCLVTHGAGSQCVNGDQELDLNSVQQQYNYHCVCLCAMGNACGAANSNSSSNSTASSGQRGAGPKASQQIKPVSFASDNKNSSSADKKKKFEDPSLFFYFTFIQFEKIHCCFFR